jgi:hypothetical protein
LTILIPAYHNSKQTCAEPCPQNWFINLPYHDYSSLLYSRSWTSKKTIVNAWQPTIWRRWSNKISCGQKHKNWNKKTRFWKNLSTRRVELQIILHVQAIVHRLTCPQEKDIGNHNILARMTMLGTHPAICGSLHIPILQVIHLAKGQATSHLQWHHDCQSVAHLSMAELAVFLVGWSRHPIVALPVNMQGWHQLWTLVLHHHHFGRWWVQWVPHFPQHTLSTGAIPPHMLVHHCLSQVLQLGSHRLNQQFSCPMLLTVQYPGTLLSPHPHWDIRIFSFWEIVRTMKTRFYWHVCLDVLVNISWIFNRENKDKKSED